MRFGITILPEYRWSEAAPRWRRAEEFGFDHAWTYDHLTWGGLQDSPWYGTTPTLTAAALVAETIKLGTFVTSPNFRHPLALTREILALDDISDGRFLCGIGAGGGIDTTILGGEDLSPRQKVDRLTEFVELLDTLLTTDRVDYKGEYFEIRNGRTLPGCVQQPRVPFMMAANGPRSLRLAARYGAGWVTTGGRPTGRRLVPRSPSSPPARRRTGREAVRPLPLDRQLPLRPDQRRRFRGHRSAAPPRSDSPTSSRTGRAPKAFTPAAKTCWNR